jgi:Rod binding domain-containing protein
MNVGILPPVDQPVPTSLPPAQVAKAWKAAQDFEAMALGQLLQPMFATVDTAHDQFGGGPGEEAWKPMFIDAIGKNLAAHGGIGIARPVFAEMLRAQEARTQSGGGREDVPTAPPERPE